VILRSGDPRPARAKACYAADMGLPLTPATLECPRTRVLRGETGEHPWELWLREPAPQLRGLVQGLWAGIEPERAARHRTLPNGEVAWMLHLGPPQRLTESRGAADARVFGPGFVAGLQERPTTFECMGPATRVVTARLSPVGAWRLLGGLPQAHIAQCVYEPDSLLPARGETRTLRERLTATRDLGQALDLFEQWLLTQSTRGPSPHGAVLGALRRLSQPCHETRTREVARSCGVSERRLRELFAEQIGVSPKRWARIVRFRRTLDALAREPARDLADLAVRCGYYDQPHLYREFRELATLTPHAYLRALGKGLDGPDVVSP